MKRFDLFCEDGLYKDDCISLYVENAEGNRLTQVYVVWIIVVN